MKAITHERAERIAKSHACDNCGEYSYKKVSVKAASKDRQKELGIAWSSENVCGVCNAHIEIGIAADGDIVYSG